MSPDSLYYVADPMCSWCFGFAPSLETIEREVPPGVELRFVMGGLAPDSDAPMSEELREYVRSAWRAVEARTGARFNWDFWERCRPRRSTYPACRAVLAAEDQRAGLGPRMFRAIQRAYYGEARNPSDSSTLVELAGELGLDAGRLATDLVSARIEEELQRNLRRARELGVTGFPSLVLERGGGPQVLLRGHGEASDVLGALRQGAV